MIVKLDNKRVTELIHEILEVLKRDGPMGRERISEALNAQAVSTACVLNGTAEELGQEPDKVAHEFFQEALRVHLNGQYPGKGGDKLYFVPGQERN